jgi:hypothetical protein
MGLLAPSRSCLLTPASTGAYDGARYEVTSQDVTEFGGWPRPPRWVWAVAGLAVAALLVVVVVVAVARPDRTKPPLPRRPATVPVPGRPMPTAGPVASWPPTARCGCGTRPPAAPPARPFTPAPRTACPGWRSVPMARCWPPPTATAPYSCGTRPPARRPAGWPLRLHACQRPSRHAFRKPPGSLSADRPFADSMQFACSAAGLCWTSLAALR